MKYLLLAVILLTAACSFAVRDTRSDAQRAATATAKASQPVTGNEGVLRIRLLTPPPIPTIAPQVLPTVTPSPECLNVKGNIAQDGRRLYHLPGMRNYNQVVIDEATGERVFCTEQDAIDAGWTKANN